jgi:hypothetical protein
MENSFKMNIDFSVPQSQISGWKSSLSSISKKASEMNDEEVID